MKEIKEALYGKLEADTALQALTGWTETDPRVYAAYPPQSVPLSATQSAYITLAFDGLGDETGPDGATLPDETYLIEIRGTSSSIVESVYKVIVNLLKDWTFDTNSYRGMTVNLKDAKDGFSKNHSDYIRTTRLQVSHILRIV